MSLEETIRFKEDEFRNIKDHEVAVVFDAVGSIIIEVHGGTSSVDLSPHLNQIKSVGKTVLVHNHPLGWKYPPSDPRHAGSSFSPEDIRTACFAELAEIRAVTPLYRFVMRPSSTATWDGDYWINTIYPILEKHKATVIRATLKSVKSGKVKKEVAETVFWHRVWSQVAIDLSLSYERYKHE